MIDEFVLEKIVFGKTVNGQNTISNSKTAQTNTHNLYTFKYNALAAASPSIQTKPIFLGEYINLF